MARGSEGTGSPIVLIISDEEWTARSLETILEPQGYAVRLAYTGAKGLKAAEMVHPDAVLLNLRLPDMDSTTLCSHLRELRAVPASTPILGFSSGPVSRKRRLASLRAGVWGVLRPPFDPEELLERLATYVAAKRDADLAREESHQDPITGFYNVQGLLKRVTELTADATRYHRSLACVIVGLPRRDDVAADEREGVEEPTEPLRDRTLERWKTKSEAATQGVANVLISVTRLSDVVARVGESEFVIVAPQTDSQGATRLAERILEVIEADPDEFGLPEDAKFRAGLHAVADPDRDTVIPEELLTRATAALREAQAEGNGSRIRAFEAESD